MWIFHHGGGTELIKTDKLVAPGSSDINKKSSRLENKAQVCYPSVKPMRWEILAVPETDVKNVPWISCYGSEG